MRRFRAFTMQFKTALRSLWWTTVLYLPQFCKRYVRERLQVEIPTNMCIQTHGCAKVKMTKSYGGVSNPGLMQSHGGTQFNSHHANQSIYDMVQDGTQGTATGDGLVANLIYYGDAYTAARGYNSGIQPLSGNLSEAEGATACYVSDLANRLTGWTNAASKCWEDPK
jgi:hypothetical protein